MRQSIMPASEQKRKISVSFNQPVMMADAPIEGVFVRAGTVYVSSGIKLSDKI